MRNVLPLNDEREHERAADCWCEPLVEWQHPDTGEIYSFGPLIVHNAADHRHVYEQLTGEPESEDKKWETITE